MLDWLIANVQDGEDVTIPMCRTITAYWPSVDQNHGIF